MQVTTPSARNGAEGAWRQVVHTHRSDWMESTEIRGGLSANANEGRDGSSGGIAHDGTAR